MYVFGGKDEDNQKLKDFWQYDFNNQTWKELNQPDNSFVARSGHSACVYNDHMLVFAGIHEITKELDDMAVYNLKTGEWEHLFKAHVEKKPSH